MIDTAEAERRVAMQRTQAAVAHARATIDEWDNMSEMAKQRVPDDPPQWFKDAWQEAVDSFNQKETPSMRQITDHRLSPASSELIIAVMDQPGPGGANHRYTINGGRTGEPSASDPLAQRGAAHHHIHFQEGTIAEAGINGVTEHALLAIVADRLRCFQAGPFSSRENAIALTKIEEAMLWLHKRTIDRMNRGVEGKHEA